MNILERIVSQKPVWADKVYLSKSLFKKLGLATLDGLPVRLSLVLKGQSFAFGQTIQNNKQSQ